MKVALRHFMPFIPPITSNEAVTTPFEREL